MLYHTSIYPYLTYCSIVWGSAAATSLRRLVILQNRAVRLVSRANFRSSCDPLFARLKLIKFCDILKFQTAQFMFRIKHHCLPLSCMRYVAVSDSIRLHDTRKKPYFCNIGCRTVIREHSINIYGPRLWDTLPADIQNAIYLGSFKRLLLDYFCSSYN